MKSLYMFESLAVFGLQLLYIIIRCGQSRLMLVRMKEEKKMEQKEGCSSV